jgi:hypothetical protein
MPSIAPPRFQWHDLPSTPHTGERAYSIFVPENETQQGRDLPELGTLWSACPDWLQKVERVIAPLQAYKLTWHAQAGTGRVFYFGKVKTDEERRTPYFEQRVRRLHYWPTVLLKQWFNQDNTIPLSGLKADGTVGTLPRVFEHSIIRKGGQMPTTFLIRHYLSDEPFPPSFCTRLFPLTDRVAWNFQGSSGSYGDCLHPKITYPCSTVGTGNVLFGAGTTEVEIGAEGQKQVFPATTMEDWEKYTAEFTPNQVLGQWWAEEVVALPPIDDREESA